MTEIYRTTKEQNTNYFKTWNICFLINFYIFAFIENSYFLFVVSINWCFKTGVVLFEMVSMKIN